MYVQQFFVDGIAHSSYLLGGENTCAIIDPRRDTDIYRKAAKEMGMEITHILETHLHADFVSGHLDLAEKTGARIYAPKSAECQFPHEGLSEGDLFEIEDLRIEVLETPGHTPEHITYCVRDTARGPEPVSIFCGDTLFVGDVGRPDLFPGRAEELAGKLYHSVHDTLLALPDFCEVYPAHGAGSLCGRAMGAKRSSTIGYERQYNEPLQISSKDEFITSLTSDMPPAPDHFSRCTVMNAQGPEFVRNLSFPKPLEPAAFQDAMQEEQTLVLDIRDFAAFGGHHIPGAYHIDFSGNFATYAGWILPPDAPILLVSENDPQAADATVWLRRVGLDTVTGYLEGGMFEWAKAGLGMEHVQQLSTIELHELIEHNDPVTILDVRTPEEYEDSHIKGALNIPFQDIRTRYDELDPEAKYVMVCGSGHRSSLGCSLLQKHGFKNILNAAGGMTAYKASGYALE